MRQWFRRRYLDLLGSIYIYNEHRGYTAIDRVLEAVKTRWPDDSALIAQVEKHRADERKHYLMFRRWFERRGVKNRIGSFNTSSSEWMKLSIARSHQLGGRLPCASSQPS